MVSEEIVKKVLYFINSNRDGCIGRMIAADLGVSNDDVIGILDELCDLNLIDICGDKPLDVNAKLNNIILITEGYTDPRYSHIY